MLPNIYMDDLLPDFELKIQPTRTYRLNFDGRPSNGMIDGLEAMKQAIYLILSCGRFRDEIFSWNYGVELDPCVGQQNDEILHLQIRDAITEALIQDDRILRVGDFSVSKEKEKLRFSFVVTTTQGEVRSDFLWWGSDMEVSMWDTEIR